MKISASDHIQHTPGSDLAAGDIVAFPGGLIGIAESSILAAATGSLAVSGLFVLPRVSAILTAWPAGTIIWWDIGNSEADDNGDFIIGHSVQVSNRFDSTLQVLLSQ